MKKVSSTIKEILFDTGLVDPRSYDKSEIAAAKCKHSKLSTIDDDVWCVAFRRVACEYNLGENHKEIKSRKIQSRGRYQVSAEHGNFGHTGGVRFSPPSNCMFFNI